jgi:hypothetical protein
MQPVASDAHSAQITGEDKEHSIKLTSLPPVTIADKQKTFLDHALDWGPWVSNFLLVIVGGFQVWLLFRTWKTIKRQADIQQASLLQWVDIQPIGILVRTKSESDPPDRVTLTLRWKVLNNTSLPFTVQRIETHLLKATTEEISVVEEVEVIPPAREGSRNFYPFFIDAELNQGETKEFLKSGILMTVQIEISYVDATGAPQDRFFGDHYFCERNSLTIDGESLGKRPEKRIEEDDSPSTIRADNMRSIEWKDVSDPPQAP